MLVTLAVVGSCYGAGLVATFRYVTSRTPAGIVRRLFRSGGPVTVGVNGITSSAWDPSQPLGHGSFFGGGRATYTLVDGTTIGVRFQPRAGPAVQRSGSIPPALQPETSDLRRRRRTARVVIGVYVLLGLTSFGVTAAFVGGSTSLRIRVAALTALGPVAIAWLTTHIILTWSHRTRGSSRPDQDSPTATPVPSHHVLAWLGISVAVAAALAVAWHVGNLDQPNSMSWAESFVSAGIFVLVSAATLSACLHHHTYLHHGHGPTRGPVGPLRSDSDH